MITVQYFFDLDFPVNIAMTKCNKNDWNESDEPALGAFCVQCFYSAFKNHKVVNNRCISVRSSLFSVPWKHLGCEYLQQHS